MFDLDFVCFCCCEYSLRRPFLTLSRWKSLVTSTSNALIWIVYSFFFGISLCTYLIRTKQQIDSFILSLVITHRHTHTVLASGRNNLLVSLGDFHIRFLSFFLTVVVYVSKSQVGWMKTSHCRILYLVSLSLLLVSSSSSSRAIWKIHQLIFSFFHCTFYRI